MANPYVWQMINEAVDALDGKASYSEIKNYINSKWQNVNEATINAQIIVLCVNHPSRIHYPENKKPRISNSRYDLLYTTARGQVVRYDPDEHGLWEIIQNDAGGLSVRQMITNDEDIQESEEPEVDSFLFPIEAHLRDFLIRNLKTVKGKTLKIFEDENGRDGREYPTKVGRIDILATDDEGDFFVFELKLSRGADHALGQLLRYMGWIKENMAKGKKVHGIIVANKMDEKIRYAVKATNDITLYEYDMKFELKNPENFISK